MSDNKSDWLEAPHPPTPKRHLTTLSPAARGIIAEFERELREVEDLSSPTLRAYLADLRHFAAWCEDLWFNEAGSLQFAPEHLTTPLITRYRTHLQEQLALKPASINRALVSIKRFSAWTELHDLIARDPARQVRFVRSEQAPPRGLSDREENALLRVVTSYGPLRDQTVIVLMLYSARLEDRLSESYIVLKRSQKQESRIQEKSKAQRSSSGF